MSEKMLTFKDIEAEFAGVRWAPLLDAVRSLIEKKDRELEEAKEFANRRYRLGLEEGIKIGMAS